jgi:hypothetical protein
MDTRDRSPQADALINEVDELNEEVKSLALNLAIYLAKAKKQNPGIGLEQLEPDFIRLVNGTVKVVQEMAAMLNAARSGSGEEATTAVDQPLHDKLELKLRSISEQCSRIVARLATVGSGATDDGSIG